MKKQEEEVVVVDADSLKYRAGSDEKRWSSYRKDGSIMSCRDAAAFKEQLEIDNNEGYISLSTVEEHTTPCVEFQIQKLNTMLNFIKKSTKARKLVLHLSPSTKSLQENFRLGLATIQPYKGNRAFRKKYKYDEQLHEYLINEWNAIEAKGQEADDECGIAAMQGHLVAAIDHDVLLNTPGRYFNYNRGVKERFTTVTEEDSWYNYFHQVLMGDSGDNIPGIYRVGENTAHKMLAEVERTPQQLYARVVEVYREYFKGEHPKRLAKIIHENASLLWIKRKPGDNYCDYIERIY